MGTLIWLVKKKKKTQATSSEDLWQGSKAPSPSWIQAESSAGFLTPKLLHIHCQCEGAGQ